MLISQIGKIQEKVQEYMYRKTDLYEIADAMEIPLDRLISLLSWNQITDGNNRPQPWINYQDIINTITLYYAMKPTHEFKFTVFGDPNDGYAKMDQTRITIQPLKTPHPSR